MALLQGTEKQAGIEFEALIKFINKRTEAVKTKIAAMQDNDKDMSIGDMFNMQMIMNSLTQLSDMTTNVLSAANQSIVGMARNLK